MTTRRALPAFLLAASVALASPVHADDFTVIALPDTQNYSEDYPAIYDAQTQWIADNAAALDIRFVTHLGDIVNEAATISQWQNAFASMSILDNAGMPYGTATGNHDFLYPGDYYDPAGTNYLTYFDPSRFAGEPWWGGASPSGLSNYQIIDVAGTEYLFLHLAMETPAAELAWAQGVLNAHQDKATWVSTHRYLYDWTLGGIFPPLGAGRYDDFNYFFEPLYRHDGIEANDFYANFVAANRQIFIVTCGHNHAEYRQTSQNNFGLTVHEVLADYQDENDGGDGWLRIHTLRPDMDLIEVDTYSPTRDEFWTDSDSEFDLTVDFDAYPLATGDRIVSFQDGVGGYASTEDTWIDEDRPNNSFGLDTVLVVDDDTTNSLFSEAEGQALLQFDALFQPPVTEADPLPAQIPTDATITSASLILHLADDENVGDTTIRVHQMGVDWSDASTWNSLGGGVNVGSETVGQIGTFQGDNDPDQDFSRTIDVTVAVESWRSGAPNHGFAIIRDPTSFNDDGIEIRSKEDGSSALRPKLSVQYSYTAANVAPTVTQSLTAVPAVADEGTEVDLVIGATDPNPLDPLVFAIEGEDVGFATGAGTISHEVLMEDEGFYPFAADVRDDEVTVPAGNVIVQVLNLPPEIVSLTPDRSVDVGRVFDYAVDAADPGPLDVVSYAWDLDGDTAYDDGTDPSGITWLGAPGIYDLGVLVSDDDGGSTPGSFEVTVTDVPADGDFDGDGTAIEGGAFTDPDDEAALAFCMAGPGVPPSPPPPYVPENCLSAFDADEDGDVDDADETLLLEGIPVPVPVPPWTPTLVGLALGALGIARLRPAARFL